jgi:hypothetical protein
MNKEDQSYVYITESIFDQTYYMLFLNCIELGDHDVQHDFILNYNKERIEYDINQLINEYKSKYNNVKIINSTTLKID